MKRLFICALFGITASVFAQGAALVLGFDSSVSLPSGVFALQNASCDSAFTHLMSGPTWDSSQAEYFCYYTETDPKDVTGALKTSLELQGYTLAQEYQHDPMLMQTYLEPGGNVTLITYRFAETVTVIVAIDGLQLP